MASRILAIRLLPPESFSRLLGALRARYPGAHIAALSASAPSAPPALDAADEAIDWRARPARELTAELQGRRFDLLVIAHGRDHYATRAYWKAALLARVIGAGETLWCEEELGRAYRPLAGAGRAAVQAGEVAVASALGFALLSLVLAAAAVTDLTEAVAARLAGPRAGRG